MKKSKGDNSVKWIVTVTLMSFVSTMFITYLSDLLLSDTSLLISLLLLILIILFGIFSDIVGVAVTAVKPQPFNAMAAQKVFGAKMAVEMIKRAPKLSSVCNDVIGDICGIVSGAVGVSIVAQLHAYFSTIPLVVISLVLSGLIAAFTIGGKAIGKDYAINNSVSVIYFVARIVAAVFKVFGK